MGAEAGMCQRVKTWGVLSFRDHPQRCKPGRCPPTPGHGPGLRPVRMDGSIGGTGWRVGILVLLGKCGSSGSLLAGVGSACGSGTGETANSGRVSPADDVHCRPHRVRNRPGGETGLPSPSTYCGSPLGHRLQNSSRWCGSGGIPWRTGWGWGAWCWD